MAELAPWNDPDVVWMCEAHPEKTWDEGLPTDCGCGAPGVPYKDGKPWANVCENCLMYRRGEIENVVSHGFVIHLCERTAPELLLEVGQAEPCPCGCEMREPGLLDSDKEMYGNAFLNRRGGRIDPTTVHP